MRHPPAAPLASYYFIGRKHKKAYSKEITSAIL